MITRRFALGALLAAGSLSIGAAAMQPNDAKVVTATKLEDNLYVMKGGGGNSAVFITATGVTVVDTKLPGWGQPLLDAIRQVTARPVTRIINTHTHYDHVSGNVEFPANVEVVATDTTAALMKEMRPITGGLGINTQPPIFNQYKGHGLATKTFKDRLTIGSGADQIDLYFFGRAHTGGDAFVVFTAARTMHTGDAFHTRDLPIMDANNGGSGVDFPETLTKAAAVPNVDRLINGHNDATTTPADMRIQAAFLTEFRAFVQAAKKDGKSIDEVVRTWVTPARYTGYAKPNPDRVRANAQVIWDETK